jgi:hypothetical protein
MKGVSPYAPKGMPHPDALANVVKMRFKEDMKRTVEEITGGEDWISQEQLEALVMFRELRLRQQDHSNDWQFLTL